jgi:hypothetical protein
MARYLSAAESGCRMRMAGQSHLRSLEALALMGPDLVRRLKPKTLESVTRLFLPLFGLRRFLAGWETASLVAQANRAASFI